MAACMQATNYHCMGNRLLLLHVRPVQHFAAAAVLRMCRLAEKIRAARVNKERSLQLQEKAALAAQDAEYDKVYDKVSSSQSAITRHQLLLRTACHMC
jgi:hypothetical protein